MKRLLYFLTAATFLGGCQKQNHDPQGSQEIQFRTYIEEGGEIRPVSAQESRTIAGNLSAGYHLSALLTTADYPTSNTSERLMWNVEINKDGSYKSASEKRYFWAEGNPALRHSFVAYSAKPTGTSTAEGVDPSTLTVAADGRLTITCANPSDPAKQIDLLYSENVRNITVGATVPTVDLVFKHRMARVMIKLMGTGGATLTKCQAKIGYKANTVRRTATLTLSDNGAINITNNYHSGTYNIGPEFSLPGSANSPATAIEVGDLILVPGQALVDEWATLTLTYTLDGATTAQTVTTTLPALDLTVAAGKQYDILVNVIAETTNLSVSAVTLTNWNAKTSTIDPGGMTIANPPTADQYFIFNGLKWAKGNLIGKNLLNCMVGSPKDHGLYFKYGSLVGWKGGSTSAGDGTGSSTDNSPSLGIYTIPYNYNGTITSSWAGVPHFNATSTNQIPSTDNAQTGIGDPCRFYLGSPWRTPTAAEYRALKYSAWTSNSGVNGAWAGTLTSGWNESNSLFFPAAGAREVSNGAFGMMNTQGGYLTATYFNSTNNYGLWLISGRAPGVDNWNRARAYPVRCVSPQ